MNNGFDESNEEKDYYYFPSTDVDMNAFAICNREFTENVRLFNSEMEKNELAMRIALKYYNEGYSKRVIDLAEYMYVYLTNGAESMRKQDSQKKNDITYKTHTRNKFSNYKI